MHEFLTRNLADREVSSLGVGSARWSITEPIDDAEAARILGLALDLGITYLDTALAYTTPHHDSHNESIIARLLEQRGHPSEVLVATKGGHFRAGEAWGVDGRPEVLRANCETSLRTLGVSTIDLYYLHFPDPHVPIEDSVGTIEQLRIEGKVRAIGVSNVDHEQLRAAQSAASISAVQNNFSPYQLGDRDLMEYCDEQGIAFVAYSPLGGTRRPAPLDRLSPSAVAVGAQLGETVETVLLAWLLAQSPSVIPLTGARRAASLRGSWRATTLSLSPVQLAAIDADLAAA